MQVTIASVGFQIAAAGAREYLSGHGLVADNDALGACLQSWVAIKLPEALADAQAALEAHMDQAAEQTFAATLVLAGIEAAKEAGVRA